MQGLRESVAFGRVLQLERCAPASISIAHTVGEGPSPLNAVSTAGLPRGLPCRLASARAESGVPVKELYQLFPKGPAKLAAKIGGIPKPKGCI
jgi:DsrC like protein